MELSRFIAKIMSKGQLTLPKPVRDRLDLSSGDYVVINVSGARVQVEKLAPSAYDRFTSLADKTAAQFEKLGITPKDVEDAVRWARGKSE